MHKQNGIYYTPPNLAEYLAKPLLSSNNQTILDPAYGEGSLLLAAERIYKEQNENSELHLFGCDIKPLNGLLKHLPEANLLKMDFFDFPIENKFQTILMNPPYVRHHILDNNTIKKYREQHSELKLISNNADLWAYFVIKSTLHLRAGGSMGAILPWAFLQADYAQPIRQWLYENFGEIKLLSLNKQYFEDAEERVILLWLKDFGSQCTSLQLAFSRDTSLEINYTKLGAKDWNSEKVVYNGNTSISDVIDLFKNRYKFTEFGKYADIKIGIVTGAVDFFIMSTEKAQKCGFKQRNLVPIINSAKQFPDVLKNGSKGLENCLKITEKESKRFCTYLKLGIDNEYDLRAHSKLRKPWYAVKIGQTPDAFFPYRVSKIPYILMNSSKIQSTNSVHRVYFKKMTRIEKMWIQVSVLSAIGQLSLEVNSKTYGREMLKLEPTSIKKSIVLKKKDKSIIPIYKEIVALLRDSKKDEAVRKATTFLNKKLKVPEKLAESINKALYDIQSGRSD
jgi:adenine-specific DNA-methyltransferase